MGLKLREGQLRFRLDHCKVEVRLQSMMLATGAVEKEEANDWTVVTLELINNVTRIRLVHNVSKMSMLKTK